MLESAQVRVVLSRELSRAQYELIGLILNQQTMNEAPFGKD